MLKRAISAVLTISLLAIVASASAQIIPGGAPFNGGTISRGLTNNGGTAQVGSLVILPIGQPSAPAVVPNTTGTTTATYYCDALDINGLTNLTGGAGNTIPSAGTTITNGATTPNTTITCAGMTGALGFVVTKNATGGGAYLGDCLTLVSGNSCSVKDAGQTLTTYTANIHDLTAEFDGSYLTLRGPSDANLAQLQVGAEGGANGGLSFANSTSASGFVIRDTGGGAGAANLVLGVFDSATNLQLDGVNIEMPQNGAAFQSGDTSSVERDLLMLDGSNIEQLGGTGVKGLSLGENNDTTTVSALPTCTSSLVGRIYKVSDSTAVTTDGQACAGSGTNTAIAMCGNTGAGTYGWKCH